LRVGVVALGLSQVIRFAGHHRQTCAVRSGIAETPLIAEAPGILAGLADRVADLPQELFANARFGNGQAAGISRHYQRPVQFEMREAAYVVEVERVGVSGVVDIRDVIFRELRRLP